MDGLLTIDIVRRRLSASRDLVERLIRSGALAAVNVSPRVSQLRHRPLWRIREADLQAFIDSRVTHAVIPVSPRRKMASVREFVK